jgi:hypothetical protein
MMQIYFLDKWRWTNPKAKISSGNAWLVYERAYNEKENKYPSMREVNRAWGSKPDIYHRSRCYGITHSQALKHNDNKEVI